MTKKEVANLTGKGLAFNTPDTKPFQDVLRKTGFYPEMKKKIRRQGMGAARTVCRPAGVSSEAPRLPRAVARAGIWPGPARPARSP